MFDWCDWQARAGRSCSTPCSRAARWRSWSSRCVMASMRILPWCILHSEPISNAGVAHMLLAMTGPGDEGPHVRADRAALGEEIRAPASDSDLNLVRSDAIRDTLLRDTKRKSSKMEQQWEELECMRSMFPADDELQFDAELMDQYERHMHSNGPRPDARLQYTIRYKVRHPNRAHPCPFYRPACSIERECITSQPLYERELPIAAITLRIPTPSMKV